MMAISVVSSIKASGATSTATPGIAATDSGAAGFADLLFSQLSNTVNATPTLTNTAPANTKNILDKEAAPTDLTTQATDPALAFLIAAANLQPSALPPAPAPTAERPGAPALPGRPMATEETSKLTEPALAGDPLSRSGKQGADSNFKGTQQEIPENPSIPAPRKTDGQTDSVSPTITDTLTKFALSPGSSDISNARENLGKKMFEHSNVRTQPDTPDTAPAVVPGVAPSIPFQKTFTATNSMELANDSHTPLSMPANIAAEPTTAGNQEHTQAADTITSPLVYATNEAPATDKQEISTHIQSSAWSHDFASKVVWLAKNDQQQVQININPAQLGPIQISLHVNGDQASATFGSANVEVRQAIESSLPQLKEMFASAGLNLGQADVGANLAQQNREAPSQSTNGTRLANENAILPGDGSAGNSKIGIPIQQGRGLVDLFA